MDFNEKINENKKKHMFGVVQFMYEQAPKYNLNPEEMYTLGLLHDIGYKNLKCENPRTCPCWLALFLFLFTKK